MASSGPQPSLAGKNPEKSAPCIPAFPLADPPGRFDIRDWDGLRPFPKGGFTPADPTSRAMRHRRAGAPGRFSTRSSICLLRQDVLPAGG
jgi:hypothetical protein